ncbi:MAG: SwmB domain-containing protein, partial [Betaproteobacteria bacterium]
LDPSRVLSTSYFQLTASGSGAGRTIQTVQVDGSAIVLQLSSALLPASSGTTYTLKYSDPTAGNDAYAIQDLAGNDVAGYPAQAITVNAVSGTDTTAPAVNGAAITTAGANAVVTLQFGEAVAFTNATGLTLTSSAGASVPFTLTAPTSDTLVLTTTTTLAATDTVTVTYNSGTGSIRDLATSPNILGSTMIIVGGDGANTISASSATSAVVIRANGGSDTLTGSSSNDNIIGGGGADTIEAGFGADTINLNEGTRATDTVKLLSNNNSWILGYDTINSFDVSNASVTTAGVTTNNNDVLNLPSGTIAADTSLTAGVVVNGIAKHLIASGIISFYNASNAPILITNTNKADALSYLSLNITQAGRTVAFALDSDANGQAESLMVFQDGVSVNGFGNSDIAAQLNGVVGVTLSNTAGQNVVQIQDTTAGNTLMRSFSSGANAVLTTTSSEDAVQYSGTITAPTILVNGIGGNVYLSSTINGTNTHTAQTSATLTQADWLLYTSGLGSMDNAGNSNASGSISFIGGSSNNVIDAGAVNIGTVTGTNIYGYAGDDQITGTAVADQIYGGTGADIMSGGLGADTFRFTQGDSPLVTGNFGADNVLKTGDMFTFAGGKADVVHGRFDVAGSSGDRIQFNSVNVASPTVITAPTNGLVTNQSFYLVQGYYDGFAGSFAVDTSSGVDTLVVYDGDQTSGVTQTALVVQQHTPTMLTASANNIYANAVDADSTAPTIASASVNGLTLTINFSEAIDDPHGPDSPPLLMVNGVARGYTVGSLVGATVTLTLASPVVVGDVVTISYTDPTSGNDPIAIQDLTGNDMASVSNFSVTNGAVVDTTAPAFVSAVAQGTTLILTYNEPLDPSRVLSTSYFQLTASGSGAGRTIQTVQVDGSAIVLQLSSALLPASSGTTYTLKYSDPTAGNDAYAIQDLAGNDVAGYPAQAITVNAVSGTDTTAPAVNGAAITTAGANAVVTLQFGEAVAFTNATGLTLTSSAGASVPFTLTAPTSDTLVLTTTTTLAATDTVTVTYNSGTGSIRDLATSPNILGSTTIIVGGDGVNTISAGSASSAVVIRANGGNNTITGSSSNDTIVGGGGTDTIEAGFGADTVNLNEGTRATDTVKLGSINSSIVRYDTINSFDVSNAGGTNNDVLNLPSGTIAANTALTAGVMFNGIAKHSIAGGIISFYNSSDAPIWITNNNKADALTYLSGNITQAGRTVGFALDSDANGWADSLMVFQDGVLVDGQYGNSDIVAQLNGVVGVTLSNTVGQNVVQILDTTAATSMPRSFTSGANAVLTSLLSEDMTAVSSATHGAVLVNGQGSDVWVSRSVSGNVLTTQTSATLAQTDWILYTSDNTLVDTASAPVPVASVQGEITAFGGSGNNVINVSSINAAGPNGVITINGNAGNDVIVGSAAADQIYGGTGADLMTGGRGADRFSFAQGDSPLVTVNTGADGTLNNGDIYSFVGGKADVIYGQFDVAGPGGDRILFNLPSTAPTGGAPVNGLVTDQKLYKVRGNYSMEEGRFFVDSSFGQDTLIVYDGDSTSAVSQTALVVQGHASGALTVSGNTIYATAADTDFTPPTLNTATVNGAVLTLNFSEILDTNHFGNVNPVVTVNGVVRPFIEGYPLGQVIKLVLAAPVNVGDAVTFNYVDPTTADDAYAAQDMAGNDLATTNMSVTNNTVSPATVLVGASGSDTFTQALATVNGFVPTTFVGDGGQQGYAADSGIDVAQLDLGALAASLTGPLVITQDGSNLSWHITDSSAAHKVIADITQLVQPGTLEPYPFYEVTVHNPTNTNTVLDQLINMETLKVTNGGTALFAWDLNTHATIPV